MIAAVPVELTDAALAAEVVDGLAQVETQLADAMRSEEELLAEASTHLLEAGGNDSGPPWSCWPDNSAIRAIRAWCRPRPRSS